MIKVKNAGIASVILSKSIAFTALVIYNPTVTRTGVIAALGTIKNSALKNNASTNINALVTAISPVRPPYSMPAKVSNVVPTTLVPKHPATIVPKESTRKDLFISFASLFSSVNPAFIERSVTVPILLKIDIKMKTNTHIAMSVVKI